MWSFPPVGAGEYIDQGMLWGLRHHGRAEHEVSVAREVIAESFDSQHIQGNVSHLEQNAAAGRMQPESGI
jgi:hypothetical protein